MPSFGTVKRVILWPALLFFIVKVAEKGVQHLVFLSIEQQQLELVAAEDYILTEFGVARQDRLKFRDLSSYARYIDAEVMPGRLENIASFLKNSPKPVHGDFSLIYIGGNWDGGPSPLTGQYGAEYFEYPVRVCGDQFCDFDPELGRPYAGTGEDPFEDSHPSVYRKTVKRFGFTYEISTQFLANSERQPIALWVNIGSEQRNALDRLAGVLFSRTPPEYWSQTTIFERDFVTGWSYLRGD